MTELAQIAAPSPARFDTLADAEPAFDPAAFEALVLEIGDEGAFEVRAVFRRETEARLRLFRAMSLGEQLNRIEREAHSLKSGAGSFGYRRLARLALQLEKHAAQLTDTEYVELLEHMNAAFATAIAHETRP